MQGDRWVVITEGCGSGAAKKETPQVTSVRDDLATTGEWAVASPT